MTRSTTLRALLTACALPVLVACGGGGGSSTPTPTPPVVVTPPAPPPTASGPTYTRGVFEDSAEFRNQCAVVRTDTDLNGNPRGDQDGSLLEELFWVRSWMNETYLYWEQLNDVDPTDFTDRQAYFDEILSDETTASGQLVDRFSFTNTTEDFEDRSSGAPTFGYGASFARIATNTFPRDWRVSFTQDGSNAEAAGLTRGARILTIDGADFLNGTSNAEVDTINGGLFPTAVGEEHVIGVRYPDGTEEDITVTSQSIAIEPVQAVRVIENGDDSVGYVHFQTFGTRTAEEQLFDAFTTLSEAGVEDVVLDLRYNGGGLLVLASQLAYMVAGPETNGEVFYTQEFQSRAPQTNPITGQESQPLGFIDETLNLSGERFTDGAVDLPNVDVSRVFVLTTGRSCSASEVVLNGLNGFGVEAIQIGTRTCGKSTGQIPVDNCGITYAPLHFRGVNGAGFGDFDGGFAPGEMTGDSGPVIAGCEVEDDFSEQLGDPNEAMLAAALTYQQTGACPTTATASASKDANGPLGQEGSGFVGDVTVDPLMESPRMKAYLAREGVLDMSYIPGAETEK